VIFFGRKQSIITYRFRCLEAMARCSIRIWDRFSRSIASKISVS
jgi:hypothetical protein